MLMDDFTRGFLLGLLVGEGHFGGDGRQAQITLRMHARHRRLFEWLLKNVPGSRLYGPYSHGGRSYYQWMVRGEGLKKLLPLLDSLPLEEIDPVTFEKYRRMKLNYRL
ncbi:hypothetical protein [Desulfovirgula thermocuniculi]|uniref:hypothetical protein n=1 Tax=Desulfovirgula thermocuniculi TaxID=348842 RepID=UPI00041464CE|nr:hypothetical protein [Desulfovirgula thermocuniculi]